MAGSMAGLFVVAFLHLPMLHVELKPFPQRERLPALTDVTADSPKPAGPTVQQAALMRSVLGGMCRNSVRSEYERRKLHFRGEGAAVLCDCLVQNMIDNRGGHDGRKGFDHAGVIAGVDRAADRRKLSDADYLTIIADAERACPGR